MTTQADDTNLEVSLLEAYCLGTASVEQAAQIEAWFSTNPGRRVWYERFKEGLRKGDFPPISVEERSAAWLGLIRAALLARTEIDDTLLYAVQSDGTAKATHQTLAEYSGREPRLGTQTLRHAGQNEGVFSGRTLRRTIISYLALGVTICILALAWGASAARSGWHSHAAPLSTYATANGERANVTLPDGNTAALDVASRLEVPADYLAGNPVLHVSGEAFFVVTHHTAKPVTVLAGGDTVRVLGTEFLVRHYRSDSTTLISVREGKVTIQSGNSRRLVITAGQQVTISRSGVMHVQSSDPARFSFTIGVLTLSGGLLVDAIPELDRWYDADIQLGDSTLVQQQIAGEYAAGSLSDLVALLEGIYNVRVVRSGRRITLYHR